MRRRPATGPVFEGEGIEKGLGCLRLVPGEGGGGLKLELELLVGAALILLEIEGVGTAHEGPGKPTVSPAAVAQPANR